MTRACCAQVSLEDVDGIPPHLLPSLLCAQWWLSRCLAAAAEAAPPGDSACPLDALPPSWPCAACAAAGLPRCRYPLVLDCTSHPPFRVGAEPALRALPASPRLTPRLASRACAAGVALPAAAASAASPAPARPLSPLHEERSMASCHAEGEARGLLRDGAPLPEHKLGSSRSSRSSHSSHSCDSSAAHVSAQDVTVVGSVRDAEIHSVGVSLLSGRSGRSGHAGTPRAWRAAHAHGEVQGKELQRSPLASRRAQASALHLQ